MKAQPRYQLAATLYHEAIPGHHIETCIAHEMEGLPKFRRFASIAAFSEGWGLYSERLRSEEHTSELQSLMRISYAVFCLKTKKTNKLKHYYPKQKHHI